MTVSTSRRAAASRRRTAVAGAAVLAGSLLLVGCGDQTEGAKNADNASNAPLYDRLPKEIKDAGVIEVGSDVAYKPMEYKDGQDIVGLDPDLTEAMSKKLGVTFRFTNGTFDGLVTSMQTGRFDMIMSAMTDTKERQQGLDDDGKKAGKGVDFVDYLTAGSSILVQKGNPHKIETLDDLCGQDVATQRGTTSHALLKKQVAKCQEDGGKKLEIEPFANDDEARVRLKAGGVFADVSDFPVAANSAKSSKDFEVVGEQMESAPYGIAVPKGSPELRGALKAALEETIDDGSYLKALKKWGVEDGAVDKVTINGGS